MSQPSNIIQSSINEELFPDTFSTIGTVIVKKK